MSEPVQQSEIKKIATEIAGVIATVTHGSATLSAVVDFCPDINLEKVKTRQIVVTPQSYDRPTTTRGYSERNAVFNVGICEKIALSDIDDRILLVEDLMKALERKSLPTTQSVIMRVQADPIYDAAWIKQNRVFVSVLVVTVKVLAHD